MSTNWITDANSQLQLMILSINNYFYRHLLFLSKPRIYQELTVINQTFTSMLLSKTSFFIILLTLIATPFLLYKVIWLARSTKTNGTMSFNGKSITGQIMHRYSVILFMAGNDSIWFNGNDNLLFKEGETVPVRYISSHPSEARINIFSAIWGDTVVYGGIPVLILLVIFLHPQIIPRQSKIKLATKRPFIEVI